VNNMGKVGLRCLEGVSTLGIVEIPKEGNQPGDANPEIGVPGLSRSLTCRQKISFNENWICREVPAV
jgi:hypothetical protein